MGMTRGNIKQRQRQGRLCLINENKVYDVTEFADQHPGGREYIEEHSERDVTKKLQDEGSHAHSQAAYNMLKNYYVGDLITVDGEDSNQDPSLIEDPYKNDLVNWDKPLLAQVVHLGDNYFDWVHQPVDRRIRLFQNSILEYLTISIWYWVPIYWVPIICWFMHYSYQLFAEGPESAVFGTITLTTSSIPWIFLLGVFNWTFLEYCIHRWVFHYRPKASHTWLIMLHFVLHGQHHKSPMDRHRLVFPPFPATVIAALLYLIYSALVPWGTLQVISSGTLTGYMVYDLIHYYLHHAGVPTLEYFKDLKKYHVLHHYVEQQLGYGISSKLWDYPFGTVIKYNQE